MSLFKNNLTFAILPTDKSWRTDLTTRFCEYYSYRLNGAEFLARIIFPNSVDAALSTCETDYLLIQQGGHVVFDTKFLSDLGERAAKNTDIVLGHIVLANDYAELEQSCLFFNVPLWRQHGSPGFTERTRNGPAFRVLSPGPHNRRPLEMELNPSATERLFIPAESTNNGSSLLIKQLDTFTRAAALPAVCGQLDYFYLDTASPYSEIRTETIFEKLYLPRAHQRIFTLDDDPTDGIKDVIADAIIVPAIGLKPLSFAEHFHARTVIIYDSNPLALALQRKIFSVTSAMCYGEIVREFLQAHPDAVPADSYAADENAIVAPLHGVEVKFILADAFSFEVENLVRQVDHSVALLIDFSDIFVWPFNYYRRPFYQVKGLFAELYSLLKSRTGPTFITGFAPGFQQLELIEVNTSTAQFSVDPTIDPHEDLEEGATVPEIMYHPGASPRVAEVENFTPPLAASTAVAPPPESPVDLAISLGYAKEHSSLSDGARLTLLTLVQQFDNFTALFEYTVNEMTGTWSFKVGTPSSQNKIEFSNGLSIDSLRTHLVKDVKINPNTVAKYF